MPTYEYQCQDCGKTVEFFQSIKEPPRTECPFCKGHIKRLVTRGGGVIFKGAGFYENDYKRKEPPKPSTPHHKLSEHKDNGSDSVKSDSEKSESNTTATASVATPSKETAE